MPLLFFKTGVNRLLKWFRKWIMLTWQIDLLNQQVGPTGQSPLLINRYPSLMISGWPLSEEKKAWEHQPRFEGQQSPMLQLTWELHTLMGSPAHRHCVSADRRCIRSLRFRHAVLHHRGAQARPRRARVGDLGVGAVPRSACLVINTALLGA